MKPDAPQLPPGDREARLTALLLGQLPAAKAVTLRTEIAADAEMAKVFRRLSLAHELTRETVRSPEPKELSKPEPLQLSAERRAALLAKFKTPPSKVVPLLERGRPPRFDWRELIAVAAMLVAVVGAAGMLMPSLAKAKSKGQPASARHDALRDFAAKKNELQPSAPLTADLFSAAPAENFGSVLPNFSQAPEPTAARRYAVVAPVQNPATAVSDTRGESLNGRADGVEQPNGRKAPAGDKSAFAAMGGRRSVFVSQVVLPEVGGDRLNGQGQDSSGEAANQFFGEVPVSWGRGIGAGAGQWEEDRFSSPGTQAVEDTVRLSVAAAGNTAGGFGGARGFYLEGLGANESVVAEVDKLALDGTPASVRFRVPVAGGARPTLSPLAAVAQREMLSAGESAPATATATDFLERKADSPLPDVAAVQLFDAAPPAGQIVAAGTTIFPSVINGPVLGSSPRGWSDGEVARGREALLEQRVNLRRELTEGSVKLAEGEGLRDQPSVVEAQPEMLAFVAPPPALPALTVPPSDQASFDRKQVAQESRGGTVAVDGFAKAQPDDVPQNRLDLGRVEPLADLKAGQAAAVAGKPVSTTRYFLDIATNAAQPALGNLPALGVMFKRSAGDGTTAAVAEKAPAAVTEGKENKLADFVQDPTKPLRAAAQNAVASASTKKGAVEEVGEVQADKKPTLLSKLKQVFGGETTRTVRLKVEKDTPDIQLLGYAGGNQTYDPYFLQNEFEVIKSRKILDRAIKELNAQRGQADTAVSPEAYKQLADKVTVTQEGKSSVLSIQVADKDPAQAARIANAIAKAYSDYRNSTRVAQNERGVAVLKERLKELDLQIAAKKVKVEELARELGIDDTFSPPNDTVQGKVDQTVSKSADAPLPKLAPGAPEPQPEVATADNAFSTFSLNVSDVSFKLAAAALDKGQMPEPATVRTEEFINAFDYRDPEPAGAAPVAFAWERARYPFAHDRDLVRFSVKTAASGRQPGRPLNLVLLLDNSGSMERADRVRIRQECLRVLAGQLQPPDRVSVVAFARTPRLWVDGLGGAQAAELPGRVGELTPDGGTNLEEALRTAYQTAARHFVANGVNRVVLLTDGAANLGDVQPDSLRRQVETNRQQGIALDCFGIGWEGLNDELLESLSRNGDGRYGFVNTPEAAQSEFAAQLVGALQIAASDVKVQVEWNPRRVTAYRQLGYAKHQLKKEQFRDNTVDAAELGAAEAGNALYTVQVNPAGDGPLGTVRVRFKVPGTGDYREHEWPLHYDGTARPLEQSGPAVRLAGSASAFSEWLVSSPWAAEVTPDRLLGLLNGVTDTFSADPRPKQLEQMLRQAKGVSGK